MDVLELRLALFKKLLEQDKPVVTEKMLPLLLQEGAASVLVNFITKTNPSALPTPVATTSDDGSVVPIKNDDQKAVKAASLFSDPSSAFAQFIGKRTEELMQALFAIFEGTQGLECNMILWQRIVERIITLEPVRVADAIDMDHALFSKAIPFMVHTPVMNVLLRCIETFAKIGISRKLMWFVRLTSRNVCTEGEFGEGSLEVVLKLLETYGNGFVKIEKDQSAKEYAFFIPLTEADFINKLLSNINSGSSTSSGVFEVLVAYANLGGSLSRLVVNSIPTLGENVLRLEEKGVLSQEKLTLIRCGLVNVLATLVTKPESSKQALDSINSKLWCAMASWFLRYHLSSIYQQQFYLIIKEAVALKHERALYLLFINCEFLPKIVEFYRSTIPGGKAYSHLIAKLLQEGVQKYKETAQPQENPAAAAPVINQVANPTPTPGSGNKKGKGGKGGARGKGKGGKTNSKNKLREDSPDTNNDNNDTTPPTQFYSHLTSQPIWKEFIEDITNEEAEQLKNALPINRDVPDASTLQGFLA